MYLNFYIVGLAVCFFTEGGGGWWLTFKTAHCDLLFVCSLKCVMGLKPDTARQEILWGVVTSTPPKSPSVLRMEGKSLEELFSHLACSLLFYGLFFLNLTHVCHLFPEIRTVFGKGSKYWKRIFSSTAGLWNFDKKKQILSIAVDAASKGCQPWQSILCFRLYSI